MPHPPSKERLTLARLTSYDDILTDALVDHVYFWSTIRKNRNAYHSSRGVREEDVAGILQKLVIIERNPAEAAAKLLQLPGLKKFMDNLRTEKEKYDFQMHLRRYINIYLVECKFEVTTTNRYTIVTHEAAVSCRRLIKKGEVIQFLSGIQVIMTPEEEEHIRKSRRDFSIVISSRNKQASLFLGPARFANHDCRPNAELVTGPNHTMMIKAKQEIDIGEEITVSYGDNYFGEDNCECLCQTCESRLRNGWSKSGNWIPKEAPEISIECAPTGLQYKLRQRRNASVNPSRDQSETPEINLRPHVLKRTPRSLSRFKDAESPAARSPSAEPSPTPFKRKREVEPLTPSTAQPAKKVETASPVKFEEGSKTLDEAIQEMQQSASFKDETTLSPSPGNSSVQSRLASSRSSPSERATSTDATSVDEETIIVDAQTSRSIMAKLKRGKGGEQPVAFQQAKADHTVLLHTTEVAKNPALALQDSSTSVSELGSDIEPDDSSMQRGQKRKRKLPHPITDLDQAPRVRIAGDYVLTPCLLGEPASAWINCRSCEEPFVQKDAYYTRSACPRCERHSKLFGYRWPKTEKSSLFDTEERILDHRTVHRFIESSEERQIRKRAKKLQKESREATKEISEVEVVAEKKKKNEAPTQKRGRPRTKLAA